MQLFVKDQYDIYYSLDVISLQECKDYMMKLDLKEWQEFYVADGGALVYYYRNRGLDDE